MYVYVYVYISYIYTYIYIYIYIYMYLVCDHEITQAKTSLLRQVFSIVASTEIYETLLNF